jgi:hypothetical protein
MSRLSGNITVDDERDIVTAYGLKISGELLRHLAAPSPNGEWFRITTVEDGVATIEKRSKYVPQQSLLEAAKTAREVMRGKDLEHVWTNYPTEPAVTLGQMLDAAIRKCEPSAAE